MEKHERAINILKDEIKSNMKQIRSKDTTKEDRESLKFRIKCLKGELQELSK